LDWGRVRFFLSEVGRNFSRNLTMQLTAIGTVAVTVLLLGAFLVVREGLATIGDDALRKIEISVFLDSNASPAQARELAARVARDPRVRSVTYVSKAAGLRALRARMQGQIDTSLLTTNPLPDALHVHAKEPARVAAIAATVRRMPHVASVEYAQAAVERLLALSGVLAKIGLGIVVLLVLTAAIVISNTIRLTVFARRREIAIMQLVGASSAYIRLPFLMEGFLAGTVGALLAVTGLEVARIELVPKLVAAISFLPIRTDDGSAIRLGFELLGVGALVGVAGAWASVGRYLRT